MVRRELRTNQDERASSTRPGVATPSFYLWSSSLLHDVHAFGCSTGGSALRGLQEAGCRHRPCGLSILWRRRRLASVMADWKESSLDSPWRGWAPLTCRARAAKAHQVSAGTALDFVGWSEHQVHQHLGSPPARLGSLSEEGRVGGVRPPWPTLLWLRAGNPGLSLPSAVLRGLTSKAALAAVAPLSRSRRWGPWGTDEAG